MEHSSLWKHFFKTFHGAFKNNRTINLLIRRGWASYCGIIGGFQLLVQNKLFQSLSCHFFYNAQWNALFTVKYFEFALKIIENCTKEFVLLLVTFD